MRGHRKTLAQVFCDTQHELGSDRNHQCRPPRLRAVIQMSEDSALFRVLSEIAFNPLQDFDASPRRLGEARFGDHSAQLAACSIRNCRNAAIRLERFRSLG